MRQIQSQQPRTSVIIPTLAERCRSDVLKRAVNSIRASSSHPVQIIAVVNGNRFDANLCNWLDGQSDVLLVRQDTPSSPLAQHRGREAVTTEYFGFLDDDDEYLPGSIDRELRVLQNDPRLDFVVCNVYWGAKPFLPALAAIRNDPLEALFERAWLLSCNALFRTESISVGFFRDPHPYNEWTWLAFRLCMAGKRFSVIDTPERRTYPTPNSLSKSKEYREGPVSLYSRMLDARPPRHIRRTIRRRLSTAWHTRAAQALAQGDRSRALLYHVRSLMRSGGLRYAAYTRRLIPGWPSGD
jgi:glycosyltransferase involved in cell wall biosynthesis